MGMGDAMACYYIQFQKGLSLREFNATYATEEQCREAICKARWGEGFVCPECGSSRHCRLQRKPVGPCGNQANAETRRSR